MSEETLDAWRQLKAHLESLRRAGLADVPVGEWAPDEAFLESLQRLSEKVVAADQRFPERAAPVQHRTHDEERAAEERLVVDERPLEPPPQVVQPQVVQAKRVTPRSAALQRPSRPASPMPVSVTAMFDKSRIPYETPVIEPSERPALLQVIADEVAACTRCPHLAATRTQTVFQSGTPSARLMFVGEAPGADEDRLGEPFVGRAGQLVTDMLTKGMGLSRSEVYIANVLKCRPPENRTPIPEEMDNCLGFLDRQIEIVRPEFICLLGKTAVTALLRSALPMKSLRGRWFRYRDIPTMVTYHPAYLLRNPPAKKETWDDLKMLMKEMGLTPPPKV